MAGFCVAITLEARRVGWVGLSLLLGWAWSRFLRAVSDEDR